MLEITIPASERFDQETGMFFYTNEQTLRLEHSLISLDLWESKYHKPFIGSEKTPEELIDYIRCMCIDRVKDPEVFNHLTTEIVDKITEYIKDPMTATWFREDPTNSSPKIHKKEAVTSEIIYYWMVSFNIPFECKKWHLNKLLTLIRVCSEKNKPPKKMSKKDALAQRKSLNEARKAKYHSKG